MCFSIRHFINQLLSEFLKKFNITEIFLISEIFTILIFLNLFLIIIDSNNSKIMVQSFHKFL